MTPTTPLSEKRAQFLSRVDIFQGADPALLAELSQKLEILHLNHDEILINQGKRGDSVYVVLNGRLRVLHDKGNGLPPTTICEVGRGESVGEMALMTDEPRTATVIAVRKSSVMKFSRQQFIQLIDRYPRLVMTAARSILNRSLKLSDLSDGKIAAIALLPISKNVNLANFPRQLTAALNESQSTLLVNSQFIDQQFEESISQAQPDSSDELRLLDWLNEQIENYSLIIYEADPDETEWTHHCLRQADLILLVASAEGSPNLAEFEPRFFGPENKITNVLTDLVLLHPDRNQRPLKTIEWLNVRNVHRHHHIAINHLPDYQRLARIITHQAISLVLSGGGTRGIAHLGIIKAFQEAGVPIDVIGGTSAGGMIAAAYASEWDIGKMVNLAKESFRIIGKELLKFNFPMISLISTHQTTGKLKRSFQKVCIEDLWINFFCMSTNLITAKSFVHRQGSLWKAIRASISIPGLFPPMVEGKNWMVDGGILNNLPVDVMSQIYPGKIIAVDVSSQVGFNYQDTCPEAISGWKLLWKKLNPFTKSPDLPSIVSIILRSNEVGVVHMQEQVLANQPPHLYIYPPVENFGMMDYKSFDDILETGYQYALSNMESWKKQLGLVKKKIDPL